MPHEPEAMASANGRRLVTSFSEYTQSPSRRRDSRLPSRNGQRFSALFVFSGRLFASENAPYVASSSLSRIASPSAIMSRWMPYSQFHHPFTATTPCACGSAQGAENSIGAFATTLVHMSDAPRVSPSAFSGASDSPYSLFASRPIRQSAPAQ